MNRQQLLEDEFVRAKPEGIRLFSPGLLTLARKLGVSRTLSADDPRRGDAARDAIILAWLMDERHSAAEIREFADAGRAAAEPVLDAYEFEISVVFIARCMAEVTRTEKAVNAVEFKVEPKPGSPGGPVPTGK